MGNLYYFLARKTVPVDGNRRQLALFFQSGVSPRDAARWLADWTGDQKRYDDEVDHSIKMRIEDDRRKREANEVQKV